VALTERMRARARTAPRPLEPGAIAWLAVLPCAGIVVLAILLLGPLLARAFLAPGADRFWPAIRPNPEPVEHARFALALLGAPLAAGAILVSRRLPLRMPARFAGLLIAVARGATVVFLGLALLAQNQLVLHANEFSVETPVFIPSTIVVAAAVAVALGFVLPRREVAKRLAALARETRARRIAGTAIAGLLVAVWLLAAFDTERTAALAEAENLLWWDMSETFAVLDGRTPLVDFHSQYAQLMPYLAAAALRVVGTSLGAWTATMLVLNACGLLAVHAVLRRIVGGSLPALALFVPFLAASGFLVYSFLSPLTIFSAWPMRYVGPYLLAWLTARTLDGAAPRRRWLLLAAAALVALNNVEFGVPALCGTLAALVFVAPPRSWRGALRLLGDLGLGALLALALVCGLSLAHGGALPRFGLLLEFPRIYGNGGWVLERMPVMGFHVAMYVTYVAAVVVGTVRAVRGDEGPVLTGMLLWSGVFGLGTGSYYAGRSDAINFVTLLSAWALALALLVVVVVRSLAGSARRPALPELAVLLGWGLAVSGILQMPRPWAELARLDRTVAPIYEQRQAVRLVADHTTPGEHVGIFTALGHRVAYDADVVDVVPYASFEAMPTIGQLEGTIDVMRRDGVRHVFINSGLTYQEQVAALYAAGYVQAARRGAYVLLTHQRKRSVRR
jgi:hypothetical protein